MQSNTVHIFDSGHFNPTLWVLKQVAVVMKVRSLNSESSTWSSNKGEITVGCLQLPLQCTYGLARTHSHFHYNQEVMRHHLCNQVLWKEPASSLSTWSQDKKEDEYLVYTRWHTTLPISFHKTSTQTGRTLNGRYSFTVVCTILICCNMTFMHSSCFPLHTQVVSVISLYISKDVDTKQLCKPHWQKDRSSTQFNGSVALHLRTSQKCIPTPFSHII